MLQAYYIRKLNISVKEIFVFFGIFMILIDLLLLFGILIYRIPSFFTPYVLIFMAAIVILIPFSIRFLPSIISKMTGKASIMAVKIIRNADTMKSLIRKENHLLVPPRPMTAKQQQRFIKNRDKMANTQIRVIERYLSQMEAEK